MGLALNSSLKRFRRRLVRHLTAVETDTALDIFSPATLQCRPPLGSVLVPLRYTYAFTWSSSSSSPYMELPMNHTHTRCCSRGITCLWVCFCTQISSVSRKPDKGWTTARHGLSSVISIHIYIVYIDISYLAAAAALQCHLPRLLLSALSISSICRSFLLFFN